MPFHRAARGLLRSPLVWFFMAATGVLGVRADARDLAASLPANTLIVIQAPSLPALLKQWDATPFAHFYRDPRAAAFFAPLAKKIETLRAGLAAQGLTLEEAEKLLNGSVALAAIPDKDGSKNPWQWLLIFEHPADPRIGRILGSWGVPAGARVEQSVETQGSMSITTVRIVREVAAEIPVKAGKTKKKNKKNPAGDMPVIPSSTTIPGVAVKQQVVDEFRFAVGPSLAIRMEGRGEALAMIVKNAQSGGEGQASGMLADVLDAQGVRRRAGKDSNIEVYANLEAIARWYEAHPKQLKLPMQGSLHGLGLTDFKWLALGAKLEGDRLAFQGGILAPAPRAGLGQIIDLCQGKPADAAGLVPARALAYASSAIELDKTWDLAMQLLTQSGSGAGPIVQLALQSLQQPTGMTIRDNVLGKLGNHIARFVLPPSGDANGASGNDPLGATTWLLDVREPDGVRSAVQALLNAGSQFSGFYRVERQANGEGAAKGAIIDAVVAGSPNAGGSAAAMFHVAQQGKWLMIGRQRAGIDAALAKLNGGEAAPLKEEAGFQRAMKELPADRFWEGYADPAGLFSTAGQFVFPGVSLEDLDDWVKPSALPPQAVWREYFGPLAGSRTRTDDGVAMQAFLLYGNK